jgi:hypothetical protein
MNTPMLKAAGLLPKTSSNGKRQLIGRLGGVKVLTLKEGPADRR